MRHHKRGGGATREVVAQQERCGHDKRGTGVAREVTMQQPPLVRERRNETGISVAIVAAAWR